MFLRGVLAMVVVWRMASIYSSEITRRWLCLPLVRFGCWPFSLLVYRLIVGKGTSRLDTGYCGGRCGLWIGHGSVRMKPPPLILYRSLSINETRFTVDTRMREVFAECVLHRVWIVALDMLPAVASIAINCVSIITRKVAYTFDGIGLFFYSDVILGIACVDEVAVKERNGSRLAWRRNVRR